MADVVRPRDLGVRLAREGVAFQSGKLGEITTEAGSRERSEIASDTAFTFDCENVSRVSTSRNRW
jgi:hypothetical protein